MTEYELFYLIGESKEADMARIKEEVKAIVEAEGGKYESPEKTEKRKLAYSIKREVRGTYIAQRFVTADKNGREASIEAGETNIIARIDHKLNLYRDILRFIIVRAEDLPSLVAEENAAASVVEEVAKEARKETVEKKSVRRPKAVVAEKGTEEKVKKDDAAEVNEADLDKKLEEVLNI